MTLLVLRALGLGDFLTGIPAYRALAAAFPTHRRILAAPQWLAPLASRTKSFDAVVDMASLTPLPQSPWHADVAVNLHGRGPQSTRLLLDTQPQQLLSFACEGVFEGPNLPQWYAGEHEVQRWCRMLSAFGITSDPEKLDLAIEPDSSMCDTIVLHPGAAAPSRWWPEERWAEIARRLQAAGVPVKITGSQNEFRRARRIALRAGLDIGSVVAGKTRLERLAQMVAGARAVVSSDTGVAHLATAVGTPSVVLFGPIPPYEWGPPLSRAGRHRVIWHGGRGDPHGDALDPALAAIGIEDVLRELRHFVAVA